MKKVVLIAVNTTYTYNLRKEIIRGIIDKGYEFVVVADVEKFGKELEEMGCRIINIQTKRHSTNPFNDIKLYKTYYNVLKQERPDYVLTYNIKPNVYAGLVCQKLNIPYIPNITGLGTAVEYPGPLQPITCFLYKLGLKGAQKVFFQNEANKDFMFDRNVYKGPYEILPGSGVNTEWFKVLEYPKEGIINFCFISRILKEKGIDQYLDCAKAIKEKYSNVIFNVCGIFDGDYEEIVNDYVKKGIINYLGHVSDIREVHKFSNCTVHPSYYPEGINNVLLESSSCGRPIITTDRHGCKEVIDDGYNGFVVKMKDSNDLIEKVEKFINLSHEQKQQMGLNGRKKVEDAFDRKIVVDYYLKEIK